MKKLHLYMIVSVLALLIASLFPNEVFAGTTDSCSPYGYTVAFVNGSFSTLEKARLNTAALELLLNESHKGEPITVALAYNPIHLAGAGDLAETVSQMLFSPISNYDFNNLLRQLSQKDMTQKLLLVGHSQGALYTNSIYDYLIALGVPTDSLGLYAVATPANYVAGGGTYVNAHEDAVIFAARAIAEKAKAPLPLPSNVHLPGSLDITDLPQTHRFLSYIQGVRDRVESDIYRELNFLKNSPLKFKSGPCLAPPPESLLDSAQKVAFAIADPTADAAMKTFVFTYKNIATALTSTFTIAQEGSRLLSSVTGALFGQAETTKTGPSTPQSSEKDFGFVKKLYGSSLDKETYEELNPTQGGAVVLALAPPPPEDEFVTTESQITVITSTSDSNNQPAPTYTEDTDLLPSPVETVENTTTTTETVVDDTAASTTPPVQTETVSTTTPTSSPAVATTSPQTPPPFTPEHSPISDTFNAFNSHGWQTFGQNVKNFDFNDGEDGECLRNGCAVGMGGNVYNASVPRMFIQKDSGLGSGAYTLYVKARAGFRNPIPVITICAAGYDSCTENGSTKGISFIGMIPLDNTWHHYYFAWKQGDSFVQSCFMRDYHHFSDCVWVNTDFPTGTKFNGVALWSTNSWRADIEPYANLWFDELDAK